MTRAVLTGDDLLAEAIAAFDAGDLPLADQLCQEIRAAQRHTDGSRSDGDTATWYLARTLAALGDTAGATAHLRALVTDREAATGDPRDPHAALARVTLGDLLRADGDLAAAEAEYRQVAHLRLGDRYDPAHLAILLARAGCAHLDADRGRLADARRMLTRVAVELQHRSGLHHRDALQILHDLAGLHAALGNADAADVLLDGAIAAAVKQYGDDHPITTRLAERRAELARPVHAHGPRPAPARRWRRLIWLFVCVCLVLAAAVAGMSGAGHGPWPAPSQGPAVSRDAP